MRGKSFYFKIYLIIHSLFAIMMYTILALNYYDKIVLRKSWLVFCILFLILETFFCFIISISYLFSHIITKNKGGRLFEIICISIVNILSTILFTDFVSPLITKVLD